MRDIRLLEATFVPIVIVRECMSEDEAKETAKLIEEMADFLATKFPVYKRTSLSIESEKNFEYDNITWFVRQRLTIGPAHLGPGYR